MDDMHNKADVLQLNSPGGSHFTMMDDDLFLGDDYLNCLIGPDVNLANITQFDSDDRLSSHMIQESVEENGKSTFLPVKSPWHESDSGVSEALSCVGSPSDQTMPVKTIEEFMNLSPMSSNGASDHSDELMAFLFDKSDAAKSSFVKITQGDHHDHVENTNNSAQLSSCRGYKRKFDFSDNEDSNSDNQNKWSKRLATVRSTKRETDVSSSYRCANVLNVIKVVKPPTSDTTTQDVMKALDERSKKNAQQAKVNREKKKIYIKKLEDDRESLLQENSKLSLQVEQMTEEMLGLEADVEYLKSVLANASALSGLLKNISNIKEVKLSATLASGKRVNTNDHSYNLVRRRGKRTEDVSVTNAGVCLHVNNGEACLEFCAHCSSLAQKTHNYHDNS